MLSKLRLVAPLTRIAIRDTGPSQMVKQLEQGVSDIGFLTTDTALPELRCKSLFREHYVLIGLKDHPQFQLKRRLTIDQFCALEHIIVSPAGGGSRGEIGRAHV